MRFRKRISLGGKSRINLSKSGVSLTTGIKGLSINVGKSGAYLNTGVPGTGIYDRHKIGGGSRKSNRENGFDETSENTGFQRHFQTNMQVNILFNDDGTVALIDPSGHEIKDPELVKIIKASPEFKSEFARMNNERIEEYQQKMDEIIRIQELTPKVHSTEEWKQRILSIRPREYSPIPFQEPQPSMDDVIHDLSLEANMTIEVRNKRKKAKLCERYVNETKDAEFNARYISWQERMAAFLAQEENARRRFEEEETARVKKQQQQFMYLVDGNTVVVEKAIEGWLSTVSFSVDFNVEYDLKGDILFVDIDLPEIEDFPDTKAQKMANGTVKYKPKSKKEIKEDYSNCVFGMAVFFAGNFFNKALNAQLIVMSGYTQRRNRIGDIVDDYIYSIVFDRSTFQTLDYNNGDPRGNCMRFINRVLQNSDYSFKTIEPYTLADFEEAE